MSKPDIGKTMAPHLKHVKLSSQFSPGPGAYDSPKEAFLRKTSPNWKMGSAQREQMDNVDMRLSRDIPPCTTYYPSIGKTSNNKNVAQDWKFGTEKRMSTTSTTLPAPNTYRV